MSYHELVIAAASGVVSVPSCIGRRMCDFAARLVTNVLPRVPIRQWVLTVPHACERSWRSTPP